MHAGTTATTYPKPLSVTSINSAGDTHTLHSAKSSKQQHVLLHVLLRAILRSRYSSETIAATWEVVCVAVLGMTHLSRQQR